MPSEKGPVTRERVTRPMNREDFISYVKVAYGEGLPDVLGKQGYAERLWDITMEFELKNEPCEGGFFSCSPVGGPGRARLVVITDHSEKFPSRKSAGKVASTAAVRYASVIAGNETVTQSETGKGRTMPPVRSKGSAAKAKAAEEAVEEVVEEEAEDVVEGKDWAKILNKPVTPTMADFADWIDEEILKPLGTSVAELGAEDPGKLIALAGTQRMEFQRSDLNRERREQRQAERAQAQADAAAEATEDEAEATTSAPAKPKPASTRPKGRRGAPQATAAF